MNIEGKYNLELNFPGDGRCFLNFWDSIHGNDVVAEIGEDHMYYQAPGDPHPYRINIGRYIELVKESINKRTI